MNKILWDIIIVGSGPAGSFCGRILSSAGLKVLVLEKHKFPRFKPCGGFLTKRALNISGFSSNIPQIQEIAEVRFFFNNKFLYTIKLEDTLYAIKREKFDFFMKNQAEKCGTKVLENSNVVDYLEENGSIKVKTSNGGEFKSKVLIGADGAGSIISKRLGCRFHCNFATLLSETKDCQENKPVASFDFGIVPSGYKWTLSGDGCSSSGYYFLGPVNQKILTGNKLFLIPSYRKGRLSRNNILIIGDAGGLTEPFLGEGDRKSTRLNSSHIPLSRMPSSA